MSLSPRNALPRTPEDVLRPVLRKLKLSSLSRTFFLHFPAARDLTLAVAWHVTGSIPHRSDKGSLLHLAVEAAFDAATALADRARKRGEKPDPEEILVTFVTALFEKLPAMVEVQVSAGDEEWDAVAGPPLSIWSRGRQDIEIVLLDEPPDSALRYTAPQWRLALFQRLAPARVRAELAPHLQAITQAPRAP